jgi:hypothetical protein
MQSSNTFILFGAKSSCVAASKSFRMTNSPTPPRERLSRALARRTGVGVYVIRITDRILPRWFVRLSSRSDFVLLIRISCFGSDRRLYFSRLVYSS